MFTHWIRAIGVTFYMMFPGCVPSSSDLSRDWHWLRESPDEWSLEGEALKLRTQPDRIWAGEGAKNLLVANALCGGSASAAADVALVDAVGKFEQCGLLVYVDDDTFVKLVVEHIEGLHYVVMGQEIQKQRKVLAKIEIPDSRARLRFEIEGGQVRGFWRVDEDGGWKGAAVTQSPNAETQRFALFSQDGPRDVSGYAYVRSLSWESSTE